MKEAVNIPCDKVAGRKKNVTFWVAFATLVAFSIILVVFPTGCSKEAECIVNGEIVPTRDFQVEVDRRLSIIRNNNPEELEGEKGDALRSETKRQVATEMIKDTLMRQQAKKLGVEVSPDVVSKQLEEERLLHGINEFEKILKSQNLTEEEYKKTIERQVLVSELGIKVCERVSYTDEELESFYLTHKDMFTRDVMVHAAHILLNTEGEARSVLQQLKAGRNFASVARAASKDSSTRSSGGDLGWIERGTMDPAFEQAAFALAAGQVSDVIKASKGFHVIMVLDRREAYAPPFKEIKSEVKKAYISQNKETVFSDWLKTVYANADVEVRGNYGKWDPLLGMVVSK